MSEIGTSGFQTVPKLGHLSVPISDKRLRDLCLKSGQTKPSHFGNLGSLIFFKQPRLVSQDFCPDCRQKKCSKSGLSGNKWDTTELSEIQISSDIRLSLHF